MLPSPEMRFIAQCALPSDEAPAPPGPLDWPLLLKLAAHHGMRSLLSARLDRTHPEALSALAIPTDVRAALLQWKTLSAFRTLHLTAALLELQREFDRRQLPLVSWKGLSLALLLYGSTSLRESYDLDFLLRQQDLPQVLEIAAQLGYKLCGQTESEEKNRYTFAHQHEFSFARAQGNALLEFHLQIMTARYRSWQQTPLYAHRAAITCALADVELLTLQPDDLLVSLCTHALKHSWDRIKWSVDISAFLHRYADTLDWETLLPKLHAQGKAPVVLLGLSLAAQLFSLTLPLPVERALKGSPQAVTTATSLAHHLMSGSLEPISDRQKRQLNALFCPRPWDRLVFLFFPLFHLEYEDLAIPTGNRLFFLNYPYRALRLLHKHGFRSLTAMTASYLRTGR